jgi:hypothetical protein
MKRALLFFSLICLGISVFAQGANVTTVITVKIPDAVSLAVVSGNTVDFDFVSDPALLTTGIEKLNAVTLTYSSNKPWFLNINATSGNFSGGDGANPMPSSIVQFKNNSGGSYTPLSTSSVSLSGTSGSKNPKGANTIGVDYKITPGLNYAPASDYSISVTYTISTI